jgi:hypothetical protein
MAVPAPHLRGDDRPLRDAAVAALLVVLLLVASAASFVAAGLPLPLP